VPSSLAHYAVAAAGLHAFEMPRRRLALVSLWGVAPDLDVGPALAWTLSAPHLSLGADALRFGGHLLGHRGFSHTVFAAVLAGLAIWGLTRDDQHALAATTAWSTHVVLDTLTDWSTMPFWPVSEASFRAPLVTGLDPLMTLASLGTIAALLGPVVADRLSWPSAAKRRRLDRWGRRWSRPLAYASVGALVFSGAMVGWAATTTDGAALPANAPRTATLDAPIDAEREAWNVTTRWVPADEGDTRRVPYAANATQAPADTVPRAECALDHMGPFAPVDEPVWTLRRAEDAWVAQARDLVRNATATGGPQIQIVLTEERVEDAWVTGNDPAEGDPFYRTPVPSTLWEDAPCL
jgi:membrane-bound metal-dependent hydrolase YbcI (DUF457 family)